MGNMILIEISDTHFFFKKHWYASGAYLNAASEWLVHKGYTHPQKLGSSSQLQICCKLRLERSPFIHRDYFHAVHHKRIEPGD